MANVAIFHPAVMRHGGGESVAAHTIEALANHHTVTLYSLDEPDVTELDARYGTSLSCRQFQYRNPLPVLNRTLRPFLATLNESFGTSLQLDALSAALIQATARHRPLDEFDLLLSTANEFVSDLPIVQYIHFPMYTSFEHAKFEPWAPSRKYRLYRSLCRRIANPGDMAGEDSVFVANSNWTAERIREAYDTDVRVIYPPVDTTGFDPYPWAEKEDGFVAIGRLHPSKNQRMMIEILDLLHKRGASHHLHIVGGSASDSYASEIRKLAQSRSYVHVEGYLDRDEMVRLVERHKYGLHGRQYEHFGIAVAELVAGGCIPFVPKGGGQVEIVGERRQLTYQGADDAASKILSVVEDHALQKTLRHDLAQQILDLSAERFRDEVRTLVSEVLALHQ